MTIQYELDDLPGNQFTPWDLVVRWKAKDIGLQEAYRESHRLEAAETTRLWRLKNKERVKAYKIAKRLKDKEKRLANKKTGG